MANQHTTVTTLSPQQERFAMEYCVDENGKAAAERAGYKKGRAARVTAARLKKNPQVKALIDKNMKRVLSKIEKRAILTREQVLEHLTEEAQKDDNRGFERVKALEALGRHYGMFIERREIGKPGAFDNLSDQELREHAKKLHVIVEQGSSSNGKVLN